MAPPLAATLAPLRSGNGRREGKRLASQSSSSANFERRHNSLRFDLVDVALLECGPRQPRTRLIEAITTLRRTARVSRGEQ